MEPPGRPSYAGLSIQEQRTLFTVEVMSAFTALRGRGMEPNEACALALKVAAGVAELPPTPDDLARRLTADPGTPLGQLCSHVTRFFASGDCLHAAFWPRELASTNVADTVACNATTATASSTSTASTSSAASSDKLTAPGASPRIPPPCSLDFTAVAALYETVLGCMAPTAAASTTASSAQPPPRPIAASTSSPIPASHLSGPSTSPRPPEDSFSPASGALAPPSSPPSSLIPSSILQSTSTPTISTFTPAPTFIPPPPPPPPLKRPAGHCAALGSALAAGAEGLLSALSHLPHCVNPGLPRQLAVLLANPLLDSGEHHDLLGALVAFIGALSGTQRAALGGMFATYPAGEMRRLVSRLHSFISLTLFRMQSITRGVEDATRLLALVYEANEEAGRRAAAAAALAAAAGGGAAMAFPGHAEAGLAREGGGGGGDRFLLQGLAAAAGGGMTAGGGGGGGGSAGWRLLEPSAFYNDAINHMDFNVKEDFRKWKHPHKYDFCFCKFPFMYDPGSKARILQMENQMSQVNELHSALFRGLFGNSGGALGGGGGLGAPDMCPFLVLRVRRGPYLVQDTLIQIHRAKESDSLKKPLKVKFIGEEGVDEGGVAKEFFQLLVRHLFNPDYGMFTADPTSHLHWFRPSREDMELEFELVGILIGMAIYNSHILEFQFPPVLYKKLMGAIAGGCGGLPAATVVAAVGSSGRTQDVGGVGGGGGAVVGVGAKAAAAAAAAGGTGRAGEGALGLEDLRDLAPEVASSLLKLLQMEPDTVADLGLVFQVDMELGFGEVEAVELLPGGGELEVTAANRRAYVDLYVAHLLQDSIAPQFGPFRRGFLRLCSGAALGWFSASELELLVCGSRQLRLVELEGATQYDDGYSKDSEPIRWFWEVVHSLPAACQKRLLFFVTGSDRVPIKGLAHLNPPFVISRAGAHSDRLPSAHTCFHHLLLPHYNSKEMLRERLELALQNAEGFGLM